jgi:hypothetical protein
VGRWLSKISENAQTETPETLKTLAGGGFEGFEGSSLGQLQENTVLSAAAGAWWRGVLLELRCTKAHLLACGVVDEADITPKALGEYVALGTTPKAFAVALRRCQRWRPS